MTGGSVSCAAAWVLTAGNGRRSQALLLALLAFQQREKPAFSLGSGRFCCMTEGVDGACSKPWRIPLKDEHGRKGLWYPRRTSDTSAYKHRLAALPASPGDPQLHTGPHLGLLEEGLNARFCSPLPVVS